MAEPQRPAPDDEARWPLIQFQIENNTKGEDVVLDLLAAPVPTLIACERRGAGRG